MIRTAEVLVESFHADFLILASSVKGVCSIGNFVPELLESFPQAVDLTGRC